MDIREFERLLAEAQAKLDPLAPPAPGDRFLSRREHLILLAGLLMGQATRKEKRYGQA